MTASWTFPLLLGLLFFNEYFRPEVQAGGTPVRCRDLDCKRGSLITTKPMGKGKNQKETSVRKFLAVKQNKIFYLVSQSRDKAKAMIFDTALATANTSIFGLNEMCDVTLRSWRTRDNAYALAERLQGIQVPYNSVSCNDQHYFDYLSWGVTAGVTVTPNDHCPVFNELISQSNVDMRSFRLAGNSNRFYNWPQGHTGELIPAWTEPSKNTSEAIFSPKKKPSKSNSFTSSSSPKRSFSQSRSWFGSFIRSRSNKKPGNLSITEKRVAFGGGGHGGGGHGGGGHGGSVGGRGGEGGEGGGNRGGTAGTAGGAAVIPRGNTGGRHSSAASRLEPLGGYKFPSFHLPSFPRLRGN